MIYREAEAYIIFFFNVKSNWTEKCEGSTQKIPNRRHLFVSRRVLPSDFLLNLALLFSTPVQLSSVGG